MTYFLILNLPRLLVVTRVYLANAKLTLYRLIAVASAMAMPRFPAIPAMRRSARWLSAWNERNDEP